MPVLPCSSHLDITNRTSGLHALLARHHPPRAGPLPGVKQDRSIGQRLTMGAGTTSGNPEAHITPVRGEKPKRKRGELFVRRTVDFPSFGAK